MTRVSSQHTRQAVLVTGDPLDPNILPEKMQLFNELGEPLMMGGGFARYSSELTTASLASGVDEVGDISLYASVRIWKLSTNRPARVRLYPTVGQRGTDRPRGIGVKPQPNGGRLLEIVTRPDFLELFLSPVVDVTSVASDDATFYYSVTNLDSAAGPVVVTFNYFRTE